MCPKRWSDILLSSSGCYPQSVLRSLGPIKIWSSSTYLPQFLLNNMDDSATAAPAISYHSLPHPVSCLRIIRIPRCFICGMPAAIYCGGCVSAYAYCSPAHFLMVPHHTLFCLFICYTDTYMPALANPLAHMPS